MKIFTENIFFAFLLEVFFFNLVLKRFFGVVLNELNSKKLRYSGLGMTKI